MWPFRKKPEPKPDPPPPPGRNVTREEMVALLKKEGMWVTSPLYASVSQAVRDQTVPELQIFFLIEISRQLDRLIELQRIGSEE